MRLSETLGLRWSDIDFSVGTMEIKRGLHRSGGTWYFFPPKSAKSERILPLHPSLLESLKLHKLSQVAKKKEWEDKGALSLWKGTDNIECFPNKDEVDEGSGDLIFTNESGGALINANISHRWNALIKDTGLPVIRYHDLRHLSLSLLGALDAPNVVAMRGIAGHSDLTTTSRYVHASKTAEKEELTRLYDSLNN